jgi:hypothetical protein
MALIFLRSEPSRTNNHNGFSCTIPALLPDSCSCINWPLSVNHFFILPLIVPPTFRQFIVYFTDVVFRHYQADCQKNELHINPMVSGVARWSPIPSLQFFKTQTAPESPLIPVSGCNRLSARCMRKAWQFLPTIRLPVQNKGPNTRS